MSREQKGHKRTGKRHLETAPLLVSVTTTSSVAQAGFGRDLPRFDQGNLACSSTNFALHLQSWLSHLASPNVKYGVMACAFPTSLLFSQKLVARFSSLDWCYACVGDVMLVVCAKDLRWTPESDQFMQQSTTCAWFWRFLAKVISSLDSAQARARRAPLNLIAPSCSGKRDSQRRAICFLTHFKLSW